jgi:hypothetical protein
LTGPKLERLLDGIGDARLVLGRMRNHQSVDDDLDRVLALFIELDLVAQVTHLAIDPHANVASLAHIIEH